MCEPSLKLYGLQRDDAELWKSRVLRLGMPETPSKEATLKARVKAKMGRARSRSLRDHLFAAKSGGPENSSTEPRLMMSSKQMESCERATPPLVTMRGW